MTIVIVPKWLLPFGYGLTLYKLAIVANIEDPSYVIAHEAEHVRQWTSIGFFRFPYLYLKELHKRGYRDNKYEVWAREAGAKNQGNYR